MHRQKMNRSNTNFTRGKKILSKYERIVHQSHMHSFLTYKIAQKYIISRQMNEFVYFRHKNNFSSIIMSLRMLQLSLLSQWKLMSNYVRSLASILYNPLQIYCRPTKQHLIYLIYIEYQNKLQSILWTSCSYASSI